VGVGVGVEVGVSVGVAVAGGAVGVAVDVGLGGALRVAHPLAAARISPRSRSQYKSVRFDWNMVIIFFNVLSRRYFAYAS
jgi:hypothetical protein